MFSKKRVYKFRKNCNFLKILENFSDFEEFLEKISEIFGTANFEEMGALEKFSGKKEKIFMN